MLPSENDKVLGEITRFPWKSDALVDALELHDVLCICRGDVYADAFRFECHHAGTLRGSKSLVWSRETNVHDVVLLQVGPEMLQLVELQKFLRERDDIRSEAMHALS